MHGFSVDIGRFHAAIYVKGYHSDMTEDAASALRGVVIVHYSAPPVVGGVETVLRNQAIFLAESGFRVRVLAGEGGEFHPAVEVSIVPELRSGYPPYRDLGGEEFEREVESLYRKLIPLCRGFDVLLIHNMLTMHFNMVATASLCRLIEGGMKAVAWCHDSPYLDPTYDLPRGSHPYNLIVRALPGVRYVTITEHRRKLFAELLGLPLEEVEVVRNGIDLSHFLSLSPQALSLIDELSLYDRDLTVISPVRVTRRKNLEFSLRICSELRYYYPRLIFIVTGYLDPHNEEAREYFKELKSMVRDLHMEDNAVFLGEHRLEDGTVTIADWKATRDIYSLSDVMLLTSYAEGFGLPLLEAGLLRIPIVCTDIPALREVASESGDVMLVRLDEDPRSVAGRIYEFLSSHRTFQHFKQVFREYNWRAIGRSKLLPLLMECCSEAADEAAGRVDPRG